LKSKPVQHSVKELLGMGIQPDILVCRSDEPMPEDIRRKISLFCNIEPDCVISNTTARSLYEVPLLLAKEGLDRVVCRKLGLNTPEAELDEWRSMVEKTYDANKRVKIALVGKYTSLHDAYLSVVEALCHGGTENGARVEVEWIDSEQVNDENAARHLRDCDGILVPGGFGDRGVEGMISAARYARENGVPYFGICYGMHMAVIEFARHVLDFKGAHTTEIDPQTRYPVIDLMPEQLSVTMKGGTMRLGKYPCVLTEGTRVKECYSQDEISERHRHRYEYNNEYRAQFEEKGMKIAGLSPNGRFVEIIELPGHPWFVGVQFHPEFKSRPNRAHPLFRDFIRAAVERHYKE
jgi:CTP synthase